MPMEHGKPGLSALPRPPRGVVLTVAALLAGLLVLGIYVLLSEGGTTTLDLAIDRGIVCALIFGGAVLCIWRAIAVPRERLAWTFLGLDLLSWGIAESYWSIVIADDPNAPYPSIADAFYLLSYPLSYVGIALLVRSRVRRFRASTWLDGAIAAFTLAAFWAAIVLPDLLYESEGIFLSDATTLSYPVADMLLFSFLFGVLVIVAKRIDLTWGLIGASLGILVVTDTIYGYQEIAGTFVEGTYLDWLWPLSAVLLGLAAWSGGRAEAPPEHSGWRSIGTPSAFALAAGGLLVYGSLEPLEPVAVALAAAGLAAVGVRLVLTYHENARLFQSTQTDDLTGLRNRSRLLLDLHDAIADGDPRMPSTLLMLDLNGFKSYNDSFGHPAGDALLRRLSERLREAAEGGAAYRIGGDEFCVLLPPAREPSRSAAARVAASLREQGEAFEIRAAMGAAMIPAEAHDPLHALQLADRRMYEDKSSSRSSARSQAKDVLMRALREREPELGEHVDQVAALAISVAKRMGIEGEPLDVISRAAELHDIGKMAIPDSVLNKPAPLEPDEWRFIADHTIVGERILRAAPALTPVAKLVRSSHERWDGDGYPDGLPGKKIPLGSRIIFACDALQAMTSNRPYAAAIPLKEAVAELKSCAGSQFDPEVVAALCAELAEFPPGPAEAGAPVERAREERRSR